MNNQILENEKLKSIILKIKKNTKLLFLISATLIACLIFILFLNEKKENNLILISGQFYDAKLLIEEKNSNEAKIILENIILKKNKVYSPLSLYLILEADLEVNSKKILNFFDILIQIKSIDEEDKNLIKIKKALYLSIFADEEKLIIELLNPIINSKSLWRKTAIEFMVKYFLNKNQKIKSEEYLKLLNNN